MIDESGDKALLYRASLLGLFCSAVGLVLAGEGLGLWGFLVASAIGSPAVRWGLTGGAVELRPVRLAAFVGVTAAILLAVKLAPAGAGDIGTALKVAAIAVLGILFVRGGRS